MTKVTSKTIPAPASVLSNEDHEFMPTSAYELIDWLDARYPARAIRRNEDLSDAHRLGGQRDLIEALKQQRSEETELAQSVDRGPGRRRRSRTVSG